MSNTRLTQTLANEITEAIDALLAAPVRFLEPPGKLATRTGRRELWHSLFPRELQESLTCINQWGYALPTTATARISLDVDGHKHAIIFGTEVDPLEKSGGVAAYTLAPVAIYKRHWGGQRAPHVTNAEAFFGEDCDAVLDWVRHAVADTIEARNARAVLVDDLLAMCKTAGQMKRMVPDLLKYLPADKASALHNQVRASTLPYAWTAYDRNAVDRAITYIAKCHMLTGLGKPFRQNIGRNEHATWIDPDFIPIPRT